uniref:RNA polymerase II-associated factor 1 homolog n=1 Tax=Aceria tosichella TaxID=561515 RepID=A0A6G1SCT7_9ACAR
MSSRPPSSSTASASTNGRRAAEQKAAAAIEPTILHSLYVKVKFNNTLPDIPFDPKFLVNPLDLNRFVDYQTTSLEQNAKHELITPTDLGVDIDLILPERYSVPSFAEHDPEDEKLLSEDDPIAERTKKSPRDKTHSQLHNKVVPWLKKTEYISTEYNRYGSSSEKTETKVGYNVRKNLKEDEVFLDKESQIKAINATFEAARKPIRQHPTKPGVTAARVLPVLPDFEFWNFEYVHVRFDSDPATDEEKMKNAIMKGAVDDDTQESMVKYFLPTEITLNDKILDQAHGLQYTEDKVYEYKSVRDYGWSFKPTLMDDYFFSIRDDAVYYNRLTLEVALKKKRSRGSTMTTLLVKHRDWDQSEMAKQAAKMSELDKPTPTATSQGDDNDLTAQSLEQSYEDMAQEGANTTSVGGGGGSDDVAQDAPASPDGESSNDGSSSSSSAQSSGSASSSPASSSAGSSSGEDSDDNKDDDDDDDDSADE